MTKKKSQALITTGIDLELVAEFKKASELKNSIGQFIQEFILSFVSEQTQRAYAKDLNFFFAFLRSGGQSIKCPSEIESHHFRLYRDHLLKKKYSSATINRRLVCVRSFIKWAMASGLLTHNPLDQVKLPKIQTETPTVAFTDEEVLQMMSAPDLNTKMGQTHRLVMILLFGLGLRRSEVVQIKLKDFYQDRGHLVLKIKGKGSKYRDMPIASYLAKEIENYKSFFASIGLTLEKDDYLIQSARIGKNTIAMNGSTVFRIIERYALECGINKRVSPHSCRATAISHLLDTQKVAIRDVAIFAGHTQITTTERYDKRRKGLDDSAAYLVDYNSKVS